MENLLNWFEVPVLDFDRASKFYSVIFNYEMNDVMMGPDRMGFFPFEDKNSSGAIVFGEGYIPSANGTLVYFNAEGKIDEILSKVESAGGKIIVQNTLITEEIGYFAKIMDTEGNVIAFHSKSK